MITVVCGTNRPGSKSRLIAEFYALKLRELTDDTVNVLSLEDIPPSILHRNMYDADGQDPALKEIQKAQLIPAHKWVFVLPEYNGSIPGIMKLFIDALSVVDYKATFSNKKLALVGVAAGRAGNLRGLDHMTNAMNYLGTEVFFNKLPISSINAVTSDATVTDEGLQKTIKKHAQDFLAF